MTIITLTTDFGLTDGYVGIMKGVILGIAPDARLVDLSHDVAPQDIRGAADILDRAAPYFAAGTVHLAVVDPGVGGARRGLVVRTQNALYVGPDNGLFTRALGEPNTQAWELNRPEYWLPAVSHTFHGRDVFAQVAAHLALGVPPAQLGRPVTDPVRLALPEPVRHEDGHISGQVVRIDRFGNLISDVPAAWLTGRGWRCSIAGRQIAGISATYSTVERGALLALIGSSGTVEIAVREGSAAQRLGVTVGEPVALWPAG